jgi:hypothetical protein
MESRVQTTKSGPRQPALTQRKARAAILVLGLAVSVYALTKWSLLGAIGIAWFLTRLFMLNRRRPDVIEAEIVDPIRELKRELSRCQYLEDVDSSQAEEALTQLGDSRDRVARLKKALSEKFEPGEITHSRYLGAAEEAQAAILANLKRLPTLIPLKQDAQVREILADNKKAIAELDQVTLAVSAIQTSRSGKSEDLEASLERLRELAARASKYSAQ